MCNLCNGTHVVHTDGGFYTKISTCPNCGPVSEDMWNANMKAIREKIDAAKEKMKQ